MQPTPSQAVPMPASTRPPIDRQGAGQPALPLPLTEEQLRQVGGGLLPGQNW